MKRKLFSLMTLLLCAVTGAWADDAITVTWLASSGMEESPSVAGTASIDDILTVSDLTKSTNISADIVRRVYTESDVNYYYADFIPDTKTGNKNYYSKDDYITFSATVKAGYTFTPTSVTAYAKGRGTGNNGAKIFAEKQTTSAKSAINNSSSTEPTTLSLTSFSKDTYEAGETITFYIHIGSNADDGSVRKGVVLRDVVLSGTYAVADTREGLTLSFTPDNKNIAADEVFATTLSWTEDTSSESAKYTITYSSSDDAVATVDTDGKVTGVAEGSATITATVTAAADATYKTTKATITVNVVSALAWNDSHGVPTGTLDLSDADESSTMLNGTWHADYGRALFGNDGSSNYLTYSIVGAYSSVSAQTWVKVAKGGSAGDSWDATGVFRGVNAYMSSAKAATVSSTGDNKWYAFRVKGVTKAQVLAKSNSNTQTVTMAAFELTASTPASNTLLYGTCGNAVSTITLSLDAEKEYVIVMFNDGSSNSRLYEMALFFDENVNLYETVSPSKEMTTYVTTNAVDFSGLGVKAYVATAAADNAVTLESVTTVPAKTPLVLKGTGTFNIPVAAPCDAPASNLLKAGDGKTTIGGESNYDFVLKDGTFYRAQEGTVAAGKAYLHLDDAPSSHVLNIVFDDESTGIGATLNDNVEMTNEKPVYNLAGQRVAQPTKGLYIIGGKKVMVK